MKQRRTLSFAGIALGLAIAIVALAGTFWAVGGLDGQVRQSPPLAGAPIGGAFALSDQDGRRVSNDSLRGRYRLVYFGYSFCPDVCPVDLQRLAQGLRLFEAADAAAAARVQPVFITVDPARDTAPVLKAFVAAFHPRLIGLTGSQADIETAKRAYRVYAEKAAGSDDVNYLMDHSAYIYLMDPNGAPIRYFDRSESAQAIADGLRQWVR